MQKWFGLFFVLMLIGCGRDVVSVTSEEVVDVSAPTATEIVVVLKETAVSLTITPTPIPTTTPTKTATAHPTATPTPILAEQFATPTLPPATGEAGDSANLYHLRPWSDAEAAALVSLMADYADRIAADYELHSYYGDGSRILILENGHDFISRYPDSAYRTKVEWQMIRASTFYPSKEMDELLAELIASDLNAGIMTLETFDSYLQTHNLLLSHQNCPSCTHFPTAIPNLLGDGREISLFLIKGQPGDFDGGVLMAIWKNLNGEFIVIPIISQWASLRYFSGGFNNFEAKHITGASQPELLVELWGQNGSMLWDSLYMFQWDGEKFVQLAGTPFYFNKGVNGDEWMFLEGDNPSRLQVLHTYDNSTTSYEWTGDSYQIVEVIKESIPPDPISVYRASDWIRSGIEQGNYSEVIDYLEDALKKPSSSYNPSGAKYHLSMRFVLGMNYVYLEDEEMAHSVFEALRDDYSPPVSIDFSRAVDAFLEHYDGLESAYEGCRAAYEVMLETELELSGISDLMPLCDFEKLFAEKLNQYDSVGDLHDLRDSVPILLSQQRDLNGDGHLDWLFALSYPTFPTVYSVPDVEVWAVLQKNGGIEVVKLTTLWARQEKFEQVSAEIHTLPPFVTPLIVIQSNDIFCILQLISGEEGWESKLHLRDGITIDYSLQMAEDVLQLDKFIDASTSYSGIDRITYQWDAELEEFVEISRHAPNSLGIPFDDVLETAESLIFESGDFAAAIPILTTIVDEFDPSSEYVRHISLPKTLYWLGLAYELQGDEAEAVDAYWQLWYDYPTDPYALMAAAKLEEK